MRVLFFDTETTGRVDFGLPASNPLQPLPVQLGAVMYDGETEVNRVRLIVDQTQDIQPGAERVHGISREMTNRSGVTLETALFVFHDMAAKADRIVAHNSRFDVTVMERTYHELDHHSDFWPEVENTEVVCTMRAATPVLKLPKPDGRRGHKWPRLEECVEHFFGEVLEGAHDALVDVDAMVRVYFHLVSIGAVSS